MPGMLGRSETRASDRTFLLLREVTEFEKNDVNEWQKCVSCDSSQLIVPDGLYLQRSLLAITDIDGRGAMPGNSSFCALGFRCEVKCNVHPYVCPSVVNCQALDHLSDVHEIRHSSSLQKIEIS